jgi:hypothetical protein
LSRSYQSVREANPVAINILYLCAFLEPDNIPEEIFTEHAAHLDPPLASLADDPLFFDESIAILLKYSLIQRNQNHTLTIHPLVQITLRNEMDQETRARWAETAARALSILKADN